MNGASQIGARAVVGAPRLPLDNLISGSRPHNDRRSCRLFLPEILDAKWFPPAASRELSSLLSAQTNSKGGQQWLPFVLVTREP